MIKMAAKMGKKENALQAIKFACFSASAGIIQIVSFTLLNELLPTTDSTNAIAQWFFNSEYGGSYLVALTLSVLWNFTFNRKFTFKSAANIPVAMLKIFAFYCVFTPVSTILGEMVAQRFTASYVEYIILAVTMATNMISEFLYCRFFVYKNSMNTLNDKSSEEKETNNV
ncbi:MAG: GtrA family protein [Clostridia bacterium]|nr:GtrA family protein [Clostridia bacterium]MBP3560785.1 GtrA family protein [Clostridia bacterium]MBQ6837577.1 GtrA family protein [Clostridia bacterium]